MRLGKWGAGFSPDEYERFIDACLDMGLKDFDHADIYGAYTTEEEFGTVLTRRPELRSRLRVTTKCGIMMPAAGRKAFRTKHYNSTGSHIRASVESSLSKLAVEKIDLLLLHRPDLLLDADDVAATIQELKTEGKVLNFGVSNYTNAQMRYLSSRVELQMNQLEISVLNPEALFDGSIDFCKERKIAVSAWSPLGGGGLFGTEKSTKEQRIWKALKALTTKYNASADQLLIAWLNTMPFNVVPVVGTSQIARVKSALEAMEITLDREDWYALLEASRGCEVA